MNAKCILLISCLILTACNARDNTTSEPESSVADASSEESQPRERLSSGDWFTAKCELLCDEEHGKFLEFEKLEKYGQYAPYDIKQVVKKDSTIITFDFIANCCMNFAGGVQIRHDTLILEYQPPHDSLAVGCDCSCDYRMIYRIDKKDKTWVDIKTDRKARF